MSADFAFVPDRPRLSPSVLALVVAAHLAVFAMLVSMQIAPQALPANALIVDLIQPSVPALSRPKTSPQAPPVKPEPARVAKPVRPRTQPAVAAPVLASASPAAATTTPAAVVDRPDPSPPPAEPVAPIAAPIVQSPAAPPTAAPIAPASAAAAPTAPRFDANYLDNPAPAYPPLSRRAGEEGRVVLSVYVEPTGQPGKVEVRTSSGYERLDKSATVAVGRWRFVPARRGPDTVGAWVLVPIVFSLKG